MGCSYLSIGCLPHDFSNFSGRSIGKYRWRLRWAMRRMRRRNVGCAAKRTMSRSGLLVDGRRAGDGERGDMGKYLGLFCCQRNSFKPVPGQAGSVSRCAGSGHSFFLSSHCSRVSRTYLFVRSLQLALFLRIARKAPNFPWIRLPRCPRWETASSLYGACKHVSDFLKLPSRQCSGSRVWEYLLRFHSLPPKRVPVFQVPPVIKSIGHVKRKFHEVIGGMLCGPARRWVQAHLDVRKTSATGGCGSSVARESSETCSPKSSGNGMSTRLPKRWCCAAGEPCRGSGDCQCGSRQKISILSVSHVLGRGHPEREFHKEFIPNCMEPCVVSWSLFIKSGRRLRSGQSWKCCLERQCAVWTFSWPTIGRPTRRGAWIGRNDSCISRHNCCKISTPGHSGLGFRKEMFAHYSSPSRFWGLPNWVRAGYKGVGDVRPACLFPPPLYEKGH